VISGSRPLLLGREDQLRGYRRQRIAMLAQDRSRYPPRRLQFKQRGTQAGDRLRRGPLSLGLGTLPPAHRRELRGLKKCLLKNLNSRRHRNRYRVNRHDRTNFLDGTKRPLTGDSRGPHVHREMTWTHTNASQTHNGHSQRLSTLSDYSSTVEDE